MRTKIYEYRNNFRGIHFSENFVQDFEALGCFELEIEVPDELKPYTTVYDNIAIEYEGHRFMLNEILTVKDDKPCISWFVISGIKKVEKLKVYSRKEKSTAMHL